MLYILAAQHLVQPSSNNHTQTQQNSWGCLRTILNHATVHHPRNGSTNLPTPAGGAVLRCCCFGDFACSAALCADSLVTEPLPPPPPAVAAGGWHSTGPFRVAAAPEGMRSASGTRLTDSWLRPVHASGSRNECTTLDTVAAGHAAVEEQRMLAGGQMTKSSAGAAAAYSAGTLVWCT